MKLSLSLLLLTGYIYATSAQGSIQISQSEDCGRTDEIPGDPRTQVPWVAGIFARSSSRRPFRYFVGGAVLDPTTVIAALNGVYGQTTSAGIKYYIPAAHNHIVTVGLSSTDLNDRDQHTQTSEVSYILPNSQIDPENGQYHFFIFRLKTPLNLTTPYSRAVCLPLFSQHLPTTPFLPHDFAMQAGYAVNPSAQQGPSRITAVTSELEPPDFCSEKFRNYYGTEGFDSAKHVYCGKTVNKNSNFQSCVSYGSSLTLRLYERWFLLGLTVLHPTPPGKTHWCAAETVYFYGHFIPALDWILDNLRCGPTEYSCGGGKCIPLSKVCDRNVDCELNRRDEDPVFCRARRPCIVPGKSFECGVYGPCLATNLVCNGMKDCPEGEDEESCDGNDEPKQVVNQLSVHRPAIQMNALANVANNISLSTRVGLHCPPLQKTEGVIIECSDGRENSVPCDRAMAGTVAKLKCQRQYVSTYRLASTSMTCSDSGLWKPYRPFGCEPQCGLLPTKLVQSFIIQGQAAIMEEPFPWHVAIFARRKNEFSYICGGSLIEKTMIVTAAHCVTDNSGSLQHTDTFKIVLGGNSSSLEISEMNPHAQIFQVKKLFVPSSYNRLTLQADIALMQLVSEVKYGEHVRPVCYLIRGQTSVPAPGTFGKVPGYGYTEDHKISETLQYANFPIINPDECVRSFKKPPPLKTYCAGYKNGTAVCQGDSGSGMVFPESASGVVEKYVLKGVVSHGDVKEGRLCDPNNYAVFTSVDDYADWILQCLDGIILKT